MNINATIFGQGIAFILFVIFCMKYVWPPIIAAIDERQKKISDDLAYVDSAKKDLMLAKIQVNNQLKQAMDEANNIIEKANKRRLKILEEAKIEAETQRNRIIAQGIAEIEVERSLASEELRKKVAMLVLHATEKIIERSVDEDTNRKIVDKLVSEL